MLTHFKPIGLPPLAERPLFSVLIRNYNYGHYISDALESVLRQTYTNFEIIVCDDGSTDNSRQVIRSYAARDPRIKLVAQENGGDVSAANTAYENSEGGLIALLDADDLFRPAKLEKALAAFQSNPRCGFYAHCVQPVSATRQLLGPPFPRDLGNGQGWVGPAKLGQGGCNVLPPTSGLSLRREVAARLFPIPEQIKHKEDYFLASTAQLFTEVALEPECLSEYRCHQTNATRVAGSRRPFLNLHPGVQEAWIEALETVLPLQKDCLRRLYGAGVADRLRLEDNTDYWRFLLRVRTLRGRRAGAFRPFKVQEMIAHIPRRIERCLWLSIALLPDPLAKRAIYVSRIPSLIRYTTKTVVLFWQR